MSDILLPLHQSPYLDAAEGVRALQNALVRRRTLVLSGAGLSTDSGIPDYRSPERLKVPRKPMRYQMFVGSEAARKRYWARSVVGWPHIATAQPNDGHRAVAALEKRGVVSGVLTQNVDGLHQQAGTEEVLELHGRLRSVICLRCTQTEKRERLQRRLLYCNPHFERFVDTPSEAPTIGVAPDGDADLPQELIDSFEVPACLRCGGVLKPDVVFFGENVPKARVERAWQLLDEADALLVLGSSLTVFSGYRFVAKAAQTAKPVLIINQGATRGDKDASLKLDAPLGDTLSALAEVLT